MEIIDAESDSEDINVDSLHYADQGPNYNNSALFSVSPYKIGIDYVNTYKQL